MNINYGFIGTISFSLIAFAISIAMTLVGFVLILGHRVSFIGWLSSVLILPLACTFYKREVLPPLLKGISYLVPPSYIFEAIRTYLNSGLIRTDYIIVANFLTLFYIIISVIVFNALYKYAQKTGSLAQL
jgi:ABC-2 type transport system permease protein